MTTGNFYGFREKMVWDAVNYAWAAHEGQTRADGKTPFIFHPLAVMIKTTEYTDMADTWVAAVLHDVLEDTKITLEELEENFGDEVAFMVAKLSQDAKVSYEEY